MGPFPSSRLPRLLRGVDHVGQHRLGDLDTGGLAALVDDQLVARGGHRLRIETPKQPGIGRQHAESLALLLGVYVISSEQMAEPAIASVDRLPQATLVSSQVSDMPQDLSNVFDDKVFSEDMFSQDVEPRFVARTPDQAAVLVNLVTYREQ